MGHARKERVLLFGTDQRITSGPAAKRLHSKAEYMTAPERFADSQIPLAPRAPSIQDPSPEPVKTPKARRARSRVALVKSIWRAADAQVRDIEDRLLAAGQEPIERERDARM